MAIHLKRTDRNSFMLAVFLFCMNSLVFLGSEPFCDSPVIGASKQMSTGETKPLTASGGCGGPYSWSVTSGGGDGCFSNSQGTCNADPTHSTGNSVTYKTPSSNDSTCSKNPTIQVTDSCGNTATLKVAINGYASPSIQHAYYVKDPAGLCSCFSDQNGGHYRCYGHYYSCNGTWEDDTAGLLYLDCTYAPCGVGVCPSLEGFCSASACAGPPVVVDTRWWLLLQGGCCPAVLSTCINIAAFTADVNIINLSSGQTASLTGTLQANGGGTTSWTITVGGQVFSGSGNSVSQSWDGRDSSGKHVDPGTYSANLVATSTGGSCGNDSDSKTVQITVKSTYEQESAPQSDSCPVDGSPNIR